MALLSISSQLQFILIQTILRNLTMVKDFPMKRNLFGKVDCDRIFHDILP
jgi:hypothetical protein